MAANGRAQELLDEGMHAFVQKPFTPDLLTRAVREVLDKHGPRGTQFVAPPPHDVRKTEIPHAKPRE